MNATKIIYENPWLLKAVDEFGSNLLIDIIDVSSIEFVKFLLSKGSDVNFVSGDGESCVSVLIESKNDVAIENDYMPKAEYLLAEGYNVNRKIEYDRTVLHIAALRGLGNFISLFLRFGADIDALDFDDETPLILAARNGHFYVYDCLVQNGADEFIKGELGTCARTEKKIYRKLEKLYRKNRKVNS